jgi:hypothetical protein
VWEPGAEPGLLSEAINTSAEAINRHIAFGRKAWPVSLTEEKLTFHCLRCGRHVRAPDAVVTRTPSLVFYECPHDGAPFVTIQDVCYGFAECELTIRVDDQHVDWSDLMDRFFEAADGPGETT